MEPIFLEFQFKDIFNWIGGLLAVILFCVVCAVIGQLGVKIRGGIEIFKFLKKTEKEMKAKGLPFVLNQKGIDLKEKGKKKILYPILGIIGFYLCALIFIPMPEIKYGSFGLLIPVILGYFGIFLVPEQLGND